MTEKIEVFISYAHEDEAACLELIKNMGVLRHEGIIELWTDHEIHPGDNWAAEIAAALEAADLILLLVSPDFINSKFCYCTEMRRAVERHKAGSAVVIPIAIVDCFWEPAPFGQIQGLPKGLKAISTVPKNRRNTIYREVVAAIYEKAKEIAGRKKKRVDSAASADAGALRDREIRFKEFTKGLAKGLVGAPAAVDALNAVAAKRGLPALVRTHGSNPERVAPLMGLEFQQTVALFQEALSELEDNDDAIKAIQGAARHLIPYLYVVGTGMRATQDDWERLSNESVIGLPAGHSSFAEIVAAGLDIRQAHFSGDVKDVRSWPTSPYAVSEPPPGGIAGDRDDASLREDLWKKANPPLSLAPMTPEQKDQAINNQLNKVAQFMGARYYLIINDTTGDAASVRRERLAKRYPALAVTVLDTKLYSVHQNLFHDLRSLLAGSAP